MPPTHVLLVLFSIIGVIVMQNTDDTTSTALTTTTTTINRQTSTTPITTVSSCQDDSSVKCSDYLGYCKNPSYIPLLQSLCPKSCGYCGGGSTLKPTVCEDNSKNCANWERNHFCTNSFYKCSVRKEYCARTCALCDVTCND